MLLTVAIAAVLPAAALAQLASMRATIPGSLHQCENTNLFFFDSDNSRPLTVLFLPSSDVPDSARSGTIQLSQAATYNPLQVIQNINTPDAQEFDFTLQIAEGQAFEVFGFLEDGSGKALSLTRTVTTPLPGASSCLSNIQTTVSGLAAGATTAASSSTSRATSSATSSRTTAAAASRSTSTTTVAVTASGSSSTTSSSTAPASSASNTNTGAASSSYAFNGVAVAAALAGSIIGALAVF